MKRKKTISLVISVSACLLALLSVATTVMTQSHAARAATVNGPALTIDVGANRHAISPGIYGISYADATLAKQIDLTADRQGGDATTNYNWLVDSSNAGNDWYFMGGNGQTNPTPGASVDAIVAQDEATNAQSVVTVPLIGYVNSTAATNCSYPENLYPNQQSYNPYVTINGVRCGNGKDASGNNIPDTNTALNYIQVDSTWMKAWIQHLVQAHGTAAAGGVSTYQMDNEPESWSYVHRDVHPASTGFDEYLNKVIDYASMIKSVDPTAQILGPSNWGVPAYFDMGLTGDNEASHNQAWIPYFLSKLYQYQQQHDQRLLNYLDVHFYPVQANNNNEDPASDAQRLRSTRSFWDPTYTEENWIGQYFTPAEQVDLIPRLRAWVKQYYPGTKISLTEYNMGDVNGLNGTLAATDALGIFGREQLDMATMWGAPNATQAAANAFRFYRNFDGNGGQYGDTWVNSASADQGQLAVYGAQRTRDNALTIVVVNKTGNDLTSNLALSNFTPDANAQVYQYTGANLTSIVQQPNQAVSSNGFSYTYPANSITEFVIPQQGKPYVGGANNNPPASQKNTLLPDSSAYSLYKGQTYPTTVTDIDANGVGTPVTSGVTFSSDNTAVATVDSNGVVTAQGIGVAHITGSYNGKSFTVTVTVIGITSIQLDTTSVTLPLGAQHLTAVTSLYSDSSTQPVPASAVTFTSDNTAVATVDATGLITATGSGTAHITASYNGFTVTLTVMVPKTEPLPHGWQHQDIGAVTTAGNVAYDHGTYNVTGAGADVYGNQDQGHFAYQTLNHDGTLIARITNVQNVQGYAAGGLMIRDGLSSGANLVFLAMFPNGTAQVKAGSANATPGIGVVASNNAGNAFPYWLKLDRTDDVITASISPDGKTWTQLAQVPFPQGTAYIGLFSTSHGATVMNTSTFDTVKVTKGVSTVPSVSSPLPLGWTRADVGAVAAPSNAGYSKGTFTLQASGADVYGTSDQEGFVYQALPGDGSITARVTAVGNTDPYAKSGVMIRSGLQAGANMALLALTPSGTAQVSAGSSTATGGITNTWSSSTTFNAPYWLRLVRSGGTVTAFTSPDGTTWTQQAQLSFPTGTAYVGLEVDSHNSLLFATSTFDNVDVSGTTLGRYGVQNQSSKLFLDSPQPGAAGSQLMQEGKNTSSADQQWDVIAVGGGYYKIVNVASGLVLDGSGSSSSTGTQVVLQTFSGADSQLWQITPSGYGANSYQIVNKGTGSVLAPQGAAQTAAPVVLVASTNGYEQFWQFNPISA